MHLKYLSLIFITVLPFFTTACTPKPSTPKEVKSQLNKELKEINEKMYYTQADIKRKGYTRMEQMERASLKNDYASFTNEFLVLINNYLLNNETTNIDKLKYKDIAESVLSSSLSNKTVQCKLVRNKTKLADQVQQYCTQSFNINIYNFLVMDSIYGLSGHFKKQKKLLGFYDMYIKEYKSNKPHSDEEDMLATFGRIALEYKTLQYRTLDNKDSAKAALKNIDKKMRKFADNYGFTSEFKMPTYKKSITELSRNRLASYLELTKEYHLTQAEIKNYIDSEIAFQEREGYLYNIYYLMAAVTSRQGYEEYTDELLDNAQRMDSEIEEQEEK